MTERDEFLIYKARAMYKRAKWNEWVQANLERIPTKDSKVHDKLADAWYQGYDIGEESLNERGE